VCFDADWADCVRGAAALREFYETLFAMDSRSAQRGQLAGSARARVIVAPAEAATTASMPAHCAGLIC
jgi:hypothetical protein